MKKHGKTLIFTLVTAIILSLIPNSSIAVGEIKEDIKIVVNGKYLGLKGFKKDNRTYVELEKLADELDYNIDDNKENNIIILSKENEKIEIPVNSNIIKVNNIEKNILNKPLSTNKKIYIPVRGLGEALDKNIQWVEEESMVIYGDYINHKEIENNYNYINRNYGYALNIPENWEYNNILIEEGISGLKFYYKKTTDNLIKEEPVFTIRTDTKSSVGKSSSENIILLDYDGFRFTEAVLNNDLKLPNEIQSERNKIIDSYRNIEMIKVDNKKYNNELQIIREIRDNYTPKNIFNNDDIFTNNIQEDNNKFFYLRNQIADEYGTETKLKIELTLDENNKLINYHFKSYGDLGEYYKTNAPKVLTQKEIDDNINDFVKKYITNKDFTLEKYIYKNYDNLIRYNEKNLGISIFVDGDTGLIYYLMNEIWTDNIEFPSIF